MMIFSLISLYNNIGFIRIWVNLDACIHRQIVNKSMVALMGWYMLLHVGYAAPCVHLTARLKRASCPSLRTTFSDMCFALN